MAHEMQWTHEFWDGPLPDPANYGPNAWLSQFGSVWEIPESVQTLVAAGIIKDLSWHEDNSPSFGLYSDNPRVEVRLWVDHPDPYQREDRRSSRYLVDKRVEEGEEVVQATEDIVEAITLLREYLRSSGFRFKLASSQWVYLKERAERDRVRDAFWQIAAIAQRVASIVDVDAGDAVRATMKRTKAELEDSWYTGYWRNGNVAHRADFLRKVKARTKEWAVQAANEVSEEAGKDVARELEAVG